MNEGDVAAAGKLPLLPLHTLGFQGFQDLCGTILGEVLGQTSAVWAPTNDAGRDGAFVGRWTPGPSDVYEGHFVVQAKHTSAQGARLTISILENELAKVSALVASGRADIYVLMTNHRVTSRLELQLVEGLRQRGIKHVLILGDHWISKQIYESSRLRALVPRVYGIGDLGEVIDARAYRQARAVLASYQDEIRTFVPTDAYRRALRALEERRFVVLVGEPGSGKSTIAAVLAWLAADQWKLSPIVVADPRRFEPHWNPDRDDQLFWADDAFGPTPSCASCRSYLRRSYRAEISVRPAPRGSGKRKSMVVPDGFTRSCAGTGRDRLAQTGERLTRWRAQHGGPGIPRRSAAPPTRKPSSGACSKRRATAGQHEGRESAQKDRRRAQELAIHRAARSTTARSSGIPAVAATRISRSPSSKPHSRFLFPIGATAPRSTTRRWRGTDRCVCWSTCAAMRRRRREWHRGTATPKILLQTLDR